MKNHLQLFTTTIISLLIVPGILFSQQKAKTTTHVKDTSHCLELTLKMSDINDKPLKGTKVVIYQGNVVKRSIGEVRSWKQKISLNRNSEYVIEVSSPGYIARRVMVSTTMPVTEKNNAATYDHDIDIVMIPDVGTIAQSEFIDFPAGVITYNEKTNLFQSDRKYMSCLKKDFDLAKMQAKKVLAGKKK